MGSSGCINTLILEGPAGTGKTHLMQETQRLAAELRFATSSFSISPHDGAPGNRRIESFLAGPESGPHGGPRPRLVLVDNFHHATSQVMNSVLSPSLTGSQTPLIWMLGLRAQHDSRLARRLSGESVRVARVELGRLSDDESMELAAELLGAQPDTDLVSMVQGAGGNPLLIVELIRGLREEGNVAVLGEVARLSGMRIPQRIREIASRWLNELSEKAQQLIQVAAAIGGSFMIGELAAMQRETTASLLPALNEAMAAGLLICPGEQAVLQHELIRRAIAEELPPAVRVALTNDIDTLRNQRRANVPLTPELLLSQGVTIVKAPAVPVSVPAVVQGSASQGLAGRLVPALMLARSVRTEPLTLGSAEELRTELTAVLADAHAAAPGKADAAARNIVSLFADDERRVWGNARSVLESRTGAGVGDADAVTATVVMSNLEWSAGNLTEGLRWGRRAVSRIGESTPRMWRPYVRLALASKLSDLGQFDEAELLVGAAREETGRTGLEDHTAAVLITRARLLLQASRLQEAQDTAQAGLAAAVEAGSGWVVPVGQAVLILVALRRGDLSSAADYVWRTRAVVGADSTVFPSIHFSWGECLVATAQLGPRRTAELLTTQYADLLTQRQLFVEEPGAAPWFVRLALAADDAPLAATVVAAVEALAAANPEHHSVRVSAAHARGLLERDAAALRRASREHVSPCSAALAEEDLGVLFSADESRNGALASGCLQKALHRFEQIGAKADADRVRALLSENSAPAAPAPASAPVRQPADASPGWDALTEAERGIAQLVGEGLTNRQIARRVSLSPHTVNYHLRVIFRKLGINSRVEVARYLA
ncbi:LuxR C-terminal-related transcriptional regulator [Streptomyces sp. NPDC057445]|uniref:helix-turn-helix transcriptional regulator n=1 Tax=Streptomyces sp. NPDC057445 TaxID=3346136 RepID=UPI00369CBBF5